MAPTVPASDIDVSVLLPSRVWEEIFRHVSVLQLLEFRLICRTWRTIIDGCPALMKRILLRFPAGIALDRDYEPGYLVPARNLALQNVRISTVDTWWPDFAQKLVFLHLDNCQVTAGTFLLMLKPMTSLKALQIDNMKMVKNPFSTVNVQLDQLETLKLDKLQGDIVELLVSICTTLKWIQFPAKASTELVIEFLRSNRCLEGVTIDYKPEILNEVKNLKQLTYLEVRGGEMNNQDLTVIGNELLNLKTLNVRLTTDTTQLTFLDTMPQLEELCLVSPWNTSLDFAGAKNPKLLKFRLKGGKPNFNSLCRYFGNSPKIIDICFASCKFSSWFEVFSAVELYSHTLQRLELSELDLGSNVDCLSDYFDGLRYLKVCSYGAVINTLILKLISLCPGLEEVYMWGINDEVMLTICKKLKHLQKLTFSNYNITDSTVDYIVDHCHALKQLAIHDYQHNLTTGAINKLKALKNLRCRIE